MIFKINDEMQVHKKEAVDDEVCELDKIYLFV